MIGSIYGDYYGSVFEKIPNQELRKNKTITDDSWFTFAYMDWLINLDIKKFIFLFNKNEESINKDFNLYVHEIEKKAKEKLIEWYNRANKEKQIDKIPKFSKNTSIWVENQKNNKNEISNSLSNGCLMRNSPIGIYAIKKNLSLNQALFLSVLFAKITHNHKDSIEAVRLHTTITYFTHKKNITAYNVKECFKTDALSLKTLKEPIIFTDLNIQPLEFWKNQNSKFIYDAKSSLDISMSCLYEANSYQEFLDLCCSLNMDSDTYCAIGGDIAYYLFEENNLILNEFMEHLKQYNCFNKINKILNFIDF